MQEETTPFRDRIQLNCPAKWVRRHATHVQVKPWGGPMERFDEVIIATHSDQALRLLADPTPREREILGAIPYQENEVVLHTDTGLLPRRKRAWAVPGITICPRNPGIASRSLTT